MNEINKGFHQLSYINTYDDPNNETNSSEVGCTSSNVRYLYLKEKRFKKENTKKCNGSYKI